MLEHLPLAFATTVCTDLVTFNSKLQRTKGYKSRMLRYLRKVYSYLQIDEIKCAKCRSYFLYTKLTLCPHRLHAYCKGCVP